ncbi:MAG: hypothetical protein WCF17_01645 [Terracidiphilus sp.]
MSLIGEGIEIMKMVDKARNVDLYRQLGEWIDKVLDLQRTNDELTTERNALRDQLRFKGVLERIGGHTFAQGDNEEICPRCAEANSIPIHLIAHHSQRAPFQKAFCPECKTEFQHNIPYNRELALRNSS